MLSSHGEENWQKNTAAVSFQFTGGDRILWDKKRQLVEVSWSSWWKNYRVQYSRITGKKVVFVNNKLDLDPDNKILETADSKFVNHVFWLNPLFHIYSPGTERYFVAPNMLLVKFTSGGKTPGDSYLFYPRSDFLLEKMKMWVKILPFKGAAAYFEEYTITETGVKIATSHPILFFNVRLRELKMYETFPPPGEEDPFLLLEKAP
ncbi:MAG: hypothetical protein NZM25_04135 [Leptospiraceae bacterium]|nr:hypothetical protein [Leptospiraceae bacterium]